MLPTAHVIPPSPVSSSAALVIHLILGSKRRSKMALEALGKRGKGDDTETNNQIVMVPFELAFAPDLALVYYGGQISVSSAKKCKIGRPKGSKNKKRIVVDNKNKIGPLKAKKHKFGAWKMLIMGDDSIASGEFYGDDIFDVALGGSGSMESVLEEISPFG